MFELPARTEPVFKTLMKRHPYSGYVRGTRAEYEAKRRAEAERIGWRQLFRWLQAQIALLDLGMVTAHEIFLPYYITGPSGQTLLQCFEAETLKLLSGPVNDSATQ
jgi:hypothetical protein